MLLFDVVAAIQLLLCHCQWHCRPSVFVFVVVVGSLYVYVVVDRGKNERSEISTREIKDADYARRVPMCLNLDPAMAHTFSTIYQN